jgi:hypothetical protein
MGCVFLFDMAQTYEHNSHATKFLVNFFQKIFCRAIRRTRRHPVWASAATAPNRHKLRNRANVVTTAGESNRRCRRILRTNPNQYTTPSTIRMF